MALRLLVAIDESPQARAALEHALKHYPDAEVTILHASDPREWVYTDEYGGYYSEEAAERARESGEELLSAAEAFTTEEGREVTTALETGTAADAIVEYAEEHDIDHIVVGSHGRRGLTRFLLGSVAETVARRSPTSVTIVRESETEPLA